MVEVLQAKQRLQRCPACAMMAFTSCCHGFVSHVDEVSNKYGYVSRLATAVHGHCSNRCPVRRAHGSMAHCCRADIRVLLLGDPAIPESETD